MREGWTSLIPSLLKDVFYNSHQHFYAVAVVEALNLLDLAAVLLLGISGGSSSSL
jgi:hypothetical protein